jgi:hypothetical protein
MMLTGLLEPNAMVALISIFEVRQITDSSTTIDQNGKLKV